MRQFCDIQKARSVHFEAYMLRNDPSGWDDRVIKPDGQLLSQIDIASAVGRVVSVCLFLSVCLLAPR